MALTRRPAVAARERVERFPPSSSRIGLKRIPNVSWTPVATKRTVKAAARADRLPGAAGSRRRSDIRSAALAPQRLWEKRRGAVGPMGSESERHTAGAWVARAAQDAALRVDLDQLDGASAAPRRERFDRVTSL